MGTPQRKPPFSFTHSYRYETVKPNKKTPVLLLILWLVFFYVQNYVIENHTLVNVESSN